jgi:FkbM family methyltransferase
LGVGDIDIFDEVFVRDVYRIDQLAKPSFCLDFGAHVGLFALAVTIKFPLLTVVSFEPESANFAALLEHCRMNPGSNIRPVKAAVSGNCGLGLLEIDALNSGAHRLSSSGAPKQLQSTRTLCLMHGTESAVRGTLVKIDVEGSEMGLEDDLARDSRLSTILVEEHKNGQPFDFHVPFAEPVFGTELLDQNDFPNEGQFRILKISRRI